MSSTGAGGITPKSSLPPVKNRVYSPSTSIHTPVITASTALLDASGVQAPITPQYTLVGKLEQTTSTGSFVLASNNAPTSAPRQFSMSMPFELRDKDITRYITSDMNGNNGTNVSVQTPSKQIPINDTPNYGSVSSFPNNDPNHSSLASLPVTTLNLTKLIIGSGMLSLPWAYAQGSLIPSIIATVISGVFNMTTTLFVIYACEVTQTFEYSKLLTYVTPFWEKVATFAVCFVQGTAALMYTIMAADFVEYGLQYFDLYYSRNIVQICFVVLAFLPLSLLPHLRMLKYSSTVGLCAIFYCWLLVIGTAISNAYHDPIATGNFLNDWEMWRLDCRIFVVLNVCNFGFLSHGVAPVMYKNLRRRSIRRMSVAVFIAYFVTATGYISFGIAGYYTFGSQSAGDILNSFYPNDLPAAISRLGLCFAVIAIYPINMAPLVAVVESHFFTQSETWNFHNKPWLRAIVVLFWLCFATILGLFLTNLGPVNSVEGAVTVLGTETIFPIMLVWSIAKKAQRSVSVSRRLTFSHGSTSNVFASLSWSDMRKTKAENGGKGGHKQNFTVWQNALLVVFFIWGSMAGALGIFFSLYYA